MTTPAHSGPCLPSRLLLPALLLLLAAAASAAQPVPSLGFPLGGIHPILAFQDLDGDGIPEAVVVPELALIHQRALSLSIHLSASNRFSTVPIPDALGATALKTRDVDGDDDLDLVLMRGFGHVGAVLLNDGAGGFQLDAQGPAITSDPDDPGGADLTAPPSPDYLLPAVSPAPDPAAIGPDRPHRSPSPRLSACRLPAFSFRACRPSSGPVRVRAP